MDERDLSAVFAAAERAERQANQAIGMIAAQAERIRKLEERLANLEHDRQPAKPPYEDTPAA